jgi:hypothetical protein
MNNDLIQKLMISKKIMEKHNSIPRNTNGGGSVGYNDDYRPQTAAVERFQPVQGSYNIPQEYLSESALPKKTSNNLETTSDAVINSKLPDEIKRLMLEHPIQKPQQPEVAISNEIVERAARLMNTKANGESINPQQTKKIVQEQTYSSSPDLKKLVKEAVKEILQESGLLVESTQKSNDMFSFKVGQHIFEGKVTKIKKIK